MILLSYGITVVYVVCWLKRRYASHDCTHGIFFRVEFITWKVIMCLVTWLLNLFCCYCLSGVCSSYGLLWVIRRVQSLLKQWYHLVKLNAVEGRWKFCCLLAACTQLWHIVLFTPIICWLWKLELVGLFYFQFDLTLLTLNCLFKLPEAPLMQLWK